MCSKMMLTTLLYVVVFVTVVKCEKEAFSSSLIDILSNDQVVSRTFGHNALKRLSFIFLPVMFTLGVISTLLLALAVISVKNLAIGVILLIVAISQAVSRLFYAATNSSPLLFHPRAEYLPAPAVASPWAAQAPLVSAWARSDNDASISD